MKQRDWPDQIRLWVRAGALRLQVIPRAWLLAGMTALLVGIGLLLVQSALAQRAARGSALAEADGQLVLQTLHQSLIDVETGQRGYLLTLDPGYLQPYHRAAEQLPEQLAAVKLRFMQNTDPKVAEHLDPMSELIRTRLGQLGDTIRAAQSGDSAWAIAFVRSGQGKRTMDQIRLHLAALAEIQRESRDSVFDDANRAESRIVPLLLTMWFVLLALLWTGYHSEKARARAETAAAQAGQLRELNARNELLARELAHRVRNLFGVVLSLVGLAARRPGTTEEVIADISGRIHSLGRAHSVGMVAAANEMRLEDLLLSLCEPYLQPGAVRIALDGPDQMVPARMVSPLALVVHELATNAAKYGALSVPEGSVALSWSAPAADQLLVIEWREQGGPPPALAAKATDGAAGGFGTRMTQAAVKQIGGTLDREWPASGAVVHLTIKLAAA